MEDVEIICMDHALARQTKDEVSWKCLLHRLMKAEIKRQEKRIETIKQYRWELAAIRVARFVLLMMSAGLAWMGLNEWAAGGVLLSALFLLAEFDRQGKLEELRGGRNAE